MSDSDHEIRTYPKSRVATFDVGRIGRNKHHIAGLLEVDVSAAKEKLARRREAGDEVGFTAWMIAMVARTVAENPHVHAYNRRRRTQVLFKHVDISLTVEREVQGAKVPLVATVRSADTKPVEEIHREIREFKGQRVGSEKDYVLGKRKARSWNKLFFGLPQFARLWVWRAILRNPFTIRKAMGTVMVTNIGLSGNASGWIVPKSVHNLVIALGSVNRKPWVRDGQVIVADILHMTILVDHDAVDGAPAARFAAQLVDNLEKAFGL